VETGRPLKYTSPISWMVGARRDGSPPVGTRGVLLSRARSSGYKLTSIPKTVEKIGERILICPQDLRGHSFQKQVELLDQAAETVLAMVKQLRKGIDAGTAREMNAKLQSIEGDADNLELNRLRDLFQGKYDPKQIIFLYDLYGLLEKVIDRCRDAGNIILQVALKYS